ncbi:serine hydrolase [Sporolactobacillus kofuensis]|uniref:Serine hydrolase n=1 Tax=Sporolactobacillus kofuensis TaxID=269672 RepID=A0ABW1WCX4_9BACL|nr:serine hydrolase [Sporolactobacillus kofuensis]MCO7174801.1 class A beta-lactamase-related serine hydrolase [Sporolactobacillus kofuensis]
MIKSLRRLAFITLSFVLVATSVPAFAATSPKGVSPVKQQKAARDRQWTTLEKLLRPVIEDAKAKHITMGISVKDVSGAYNGAGLNIGNVGPYKAASTIKLGLASLIMKGVDQGKWSLDTKVTVHPSDIVGGSGTLQNAGVAAYPQNITLGRLMRLMITVSDNTATNVLIDFAGGFDKINAFTQSLGLDDSGFHFGRKMILPHTSEQENWISPDEDVQLLDMIYRSTFLSRASSSQIISWMRQQQVNTKFGAVIPRDVLANKTGENTDVSHDTGYILVNGHEVALSVMTSFNPSDFPDWNTAFNTANQEVQQAGQVVYDYVNKNAPKVKNGKDRRWTSLQKKLAPVVKDAAAKHVTIGISVKDVSGAYNGASLNIGSMGPYKAASTIKLGLASLIMKGVDQGKWSLDTKVTVHPSDIVGGSGILQNAGAAAYPQDITLGRLMRLMITVSDNTATNVLIDFAGGFDKINAFTQSLGLADSGLHFGRKMILPHTAEQENWISPDEDAQLLNMIYRSTFLSRASSSQIISWMRQQQVNTKFGTVIPRDVLAN